MRRKRIWVICDWWTLGSETLWSKKLRWLGFEKIEIIKNKIEIGIWKVWDLRILGFGNNGIFEFWDWRRMGSENIEVWGNWQDWDSRRLGTEKIEIGNWSSDIGIWQVWDLRWLGLSNIGIWQDWDWRSLGSERIEVCEHSDLRKWTHEIIKIWQKREIELAIEKHWDLNGCDLRNWDDSDLTRLSP